MTMIDVDTSPLEAAREWRGISQVAAAVNAGLPLVQAEALEAGDPSAFASIDEMIAAAVVYGSSIGIGRDEAVALLDRTVCGTGPKVELPDPVGVQRPGTAFSGAVQERSARIADRRVEVSPAISHPAADADEAELDVRPAVDSIDEALEAMPLMDLPAVPEGPTPAQAVAASGELLLDESFGPEAPWERVGHTGELEAWAGDFGDLDAGSAVLHGSSGDSRFVGAVHATLERVIGTDRADGAARWVARTSDRAAGLTRDGRERLRRSEHATLIVAIGGGALLIALVVAIGGALGTDEPTGPGPANRAAVIDAATATADEPGANEKVADKPKADAPVAIIAPARLTLDIFNAGSKKGYAKEVADKLDAAGYKIGEVTNAKSSYTSATIIHPKDMSREAKRLARQTGITTLQVAPGSSRRITVIVM